MKTSTKSLNRQESFRSKKIGTGFNDNQSQKSDKSKKLVIRRPKADTPNSSVQKSTKRRQDSHQKS